MLCVAVGKWTKILCLRRNFRKEGQRCVVKKPLQFFNFSVTISRNERTYTLPFTINTIHKRFHWSSLTRDALWSAKKIDENFFFLAFRLVINKPNHRSLSLILWWYLTIDLELLVVNKFLKHLYATTDIRKKTVRFQLDSGAFSNVISEETQKLFGFSESWRNWTGDIYVQSDDTKTGMYECTLELHNRKTDKRYCTEPVVLKEQRPPCAWIWSKYDLRICCCRLLDLTRNL